LLAILIYLASVPACLYAPSVSGWGLHEGILLTYAGIPLSIASAAQARVAPDIVTREPWGVVLAISWLAGSTFLCLPGLPITNPVAQAVVIGSILVLAAVVVFLAIARAVVTERTHVISARGLYGVALLAFGILFLRGGLRALSSADGGAMAGTFDAAQWFRVAVLGSAALTVMAGILLWGVGRRRRTRS
jgi:hypothetical protein